MQKLQKEAKELTELTKLKEKKELKEEKMKTLQMLENRQEPLTVKELAKILGNSPTTIYRRIHNGELEAFRDGWLIKILPAVAVEWVKQLIAKGCRRKKRTMRPESPLEGGEAAV